MRKTTLALVAGVVALAFCALVARAATKTNASFEQMKSLAGTWTAMDDKGTTTTSTIRVVSNGTAIEEIFQSTEAHQMVTLYTPDGDKLAMIHLCELGNQPRMETPAVSDKTDTFEFSFTGATNLASPNDPHMHRMALHVIDSDHFDETWTLSANGKEQEHAVFHFTRKKA